MDVLKRTGFIETVMFRPIELVFGMFHKMTKGKYDIGAKLCANINLDFKVDLHEQWRDPDIILDVLKTQDIEYTYFCIPHIPFLYHHVPPAISRKLVGIMRKLASVCKIKKATVFIIYARKKRR